MNIVGNVINGIKDTSRQKGIINYIDKNNNKFNNNKNF